MPRPHLPLWPIHPKPLPGEILSSWLSRIADSYGSSLHSFRKANLPKINGQATDVDQITQLNFFKVLSECTGVTIDDALSRGFALDEGRIYSKTLANYLEWVAPLSIMDGEKRRYAIPFCPSCLATDDVPYYRKNWRIAFHPVCPKHGLLTYRCPTCQHLYCYQQSEQARSLGLPSGVMGVCRYCENPFNSTTIAGLDDKALQSVTDIQGSLLKALDDGWIEAGSKRDIHICAYLQGLRILGRVFQNPQVGPKCLSFVGPQTGMQFPKWNHRDWVGPLESRSAPIRAWLVILSTWLAGEWPERFIAMMTSFDINVAHLLPAERPYWMHEQEIDEHSRRLAPRSKEEIAAARSALTRLRNWAPFGTELEEFIQTGQVLPIQPLSRPVSPGNSVRIRTYEAHISAFHEIREDFINTANDQPRELYPPLELTYRAGNPIDDLDDTSEQLAALREWEREDKGKAMDG